MSDEDFPERETSKQLPARETGRQRDEPPRMRDEGSPLGALFQRAAEDPGLHADAVERVVARAEETPPTPPTPGAAMWPGTLAVLGLLALGGLATWHFWPAESVAPAASLPPIAAPLEVPTAPVEVPPAPPLVMPQETPEVETHEVIEAPHRPARVQTQAPVEVAPPPTEGMLLLRARAALPRDAASALALAEEHRELYPHGVMTSEREVLAIEALVALGRAQEADARASRFLRDHSDSPYRSRVEHAIEHAP